MTSSQCPLDKQSYNTTIHVQGDLPLPRIEKSKVLVMVVASSLNPTDGLSSFLQTSRRGSNKDQSSLVTEMHLVTVQS